MSPAKKAEVVTAREREAFRDQGWLGGGGMDTLPGLGLHVETHPHVQPPRPPSPLAQRRLILLLGLDTGKPWLTTVRHVQEESQLQRVYILVFS